MATFDINDVARRVQYTSTGQTGPFNFTFQVNASSELLVYINDTVKTETTHYTVSLNADGTGSVTFGTATTTGELITIIGDQPLSRTTVFQVGQVNQPTTLETEFDNTLIRQQQIKEITDRSIQLKPSTGRTVTGSGTSGPLYFPYNTTVANNANRVLKYDSAGTSLELGSTTTNIDALAAIASDITTVSGISGNVTTVAGIASNVTSVASNASNINTVATNIANVNTVAGISSNVTTVAGLSTEITALSGVSSSDLVAVAALGTELATLAPIASDITTVAGVSGNVTTVAGISSDVSTVSGISANTTTVAGIASNVTTVAGISSDVSTVAGISANVTTVAGDTANIATVAGNTTNINTVATNITDVNTFANRYRIAATDPTTSLDIGDLYYDTTNDIMKVYGSSGWQNAGSSVNGTSARFQYVVTSSTTTLTGTDANGATLLYDPVYVDVYLNGVKMVNGTDVTVTSGNSVVFASPIGTSGTDYVDIIGYGTFNVASISTTSITSGTLGYARGGTGLGTLGSADEVLQMNSGGTALEYGKVQAGNLDVAGNGTAGQVLKSDGDGSFSWADSASPFAYNAVTGTTPSLDVGTYNFFDNGTLSGNTTVSFTNVPTEARWQYTTIASNVNPYNLSGATDDSNSISLNTGTEPITAVYSVSFKSDGSKMYSLDSANNEIQAYNLSTPWDLTTAVYNAKYNHGNGGMLQLFFKTDGTKVFLLRYTPTQLIYEYALSTAWDITTASFTTTYTHTLSSTIRSFTFANNGTKMYIGDGGGSGTIYEYSLSTGWDLSTVSYSGNSYNTSAFIGAGPYGLSVKDDGTKMYASGHSTGKIHEIDLSTAYSLSGASYNSVALDLAALYTGISPWQMYWALNGGKLFVAETNTNTIKRFSTADFTTITLPASVKNTPKETFSAGDRVFYDFYTADSGTNVYLINEDIT